MGLFEHIAVLMSLVFAVALTHLLASTTDIVIARDRVKISWLHMAWMTAAFLLLFTNWLALWDLRRVEHWTVAQVSVQFGFSVVQYFSCSLISPKIPEEGKVDLFDFEKRQAPIYIGAINVLAIFAMLTNYFFRDANPENAPNSWILQDLTILPMIAILTAAMIFRARWISWLAALSMIAMTLYFVTQFTLT